MWNLFKRKKKEHISSFWEMQRDRDQERYKMLQGWEDRAVEKDARAVARDMLMQWISNYWDDLRSGFPPQWRGMGIIIKKPMRYVLNQYPGQTPKYDNDGYQKLINDEFKRLKDEWRNENRILDCYVSAP